MPGGPAAAPPAAAVAAEGLEFRYGDRRALGGLTFEVRPREIFGFLGPNGGGKTTLFRILTTLFRPRAGRVRLFGLDPVARSREVRRLLGVVFQSPSLDLQLTLRENLLHQGHLYGLRGGELAARIDGCLERFGLAARAGERVAGLSGGLRRRVEIAKALLHRPPLLLLDEPSSGLDPGARRDLWRALEGLREQDGTTVLLTTHFMEEADRCDRLALLDRGEIVARGTPTELKEEIGGDVVLVRAEDPGRLARELGERFALEATVRDGLVRFERERAHEFVSRLAESFPGRIQAVTVAKPTLEDVFLHRTGRGLWEGEAPGFREAGP